MKREMMKMKQRNWLRVTFEEEELLFAKVSILWGVESYWGNAGNVRIKRIVNDDSTICITYYKLHVRKSKRKFVLTVYFFKNCCNLASELKLEIHAGHGLDYKTTKLLAKINEIKEFNIGHFIIGESIFYGLKNIISKFKKISNN